MPRRPPASVLTILGALVEERVGLHYRMEETDLFWSKVASRMEEAGFDNALDYYYFLRYDDQARIELDALVEALVVGETYLFRQIDPLRAAITHVVRPAIEARGRARIWSAACSTGEEPFTLAMLAAHEGILGSTDIFATDVSERSIRRARAGNLSHRAFRAVDEAPELTARWLVPDADGKLTVASTIRQAIRFDRLN